MWSVKLWPFGPGGDKLFDMAPYLTVHISGWLAVGTIHMASAMWLQGILIVSLGCVELYTTVEYMHITNKGHVLLGHLTLDVLIFQREPKHIFTFYVIAPYRHETGSWNHSSSKTITYLFYRVNIMDAYVLAMQGARSSANMIFTMLNWINLVPAR